MSIRNSFRAGFLLRLQRAFTSLQSLGSLRPSSFPLLGFAENQIDHFIPASSRHLTSSAEKDDSPTVEGPPRRRRRRRHNFDVTQVPSFEAFQQQQQIRSLYRQFFRLAYKSSSRDDLAVQIRREFRQVVSADDDPWALKRALSEGGRRYKELSAMLSSVPGSGQQQKESNEANKKSKQSSAWPWQSSKSVKKPLAFPKRWKSRGR